MAIYSLPVQNKPGSYDGDMLVKQYSSLTINDGNILTVDQPCRGLMIYVQGNCTINGTLSMTARGAFADPTVAGASDSSIVSSSGLQMPFLTALDTQTLAASAALFNGTGTAARSLIAQHKSISGNGKIVTFVRQGASGGAGGGSGYQWRPGAVGSDGSTGQTGGGAGGTGGYGDPSGFGGPGGSGSYGSCFSGGSGGGDGQYDSRTGGDAQAWGGRGGNAAARDGYDALGGVGNPVGSSAGGSAAVPQLSSGTGGLLILVVGGNLIFGPNGRIMSQGSTSASSAGSPQWRGGSSGGGNILVAYRGSISNRNTTVAISTSTSSDRLVTVTTSTAHNFSTGDSVTITGTAQSGTFRINAVTSLTQFNYYANVDNSTAVPTGASVQLDRINVMGGGGAMVDGQGQKQFGNKGGAGSKQVLQVL